jgi:zinc protease
MLAGCGGDPEPAGNGGGAEKKPATPALRRFPDRGATNILSGVATGTLENGLTVILRERRGVPVVTCELAFRVGSVDERDKERGIAHFLEHMLFKGSTSFKKGEIDAFTARNGGQNNAYTTRDMTAYHFTMPSAGLEAALKILKEMLGESTLDEKEFEAEKGPVREELHSGEDDPWTRLWERTQKEAFAKHPYMHPVIGYEPEIVAMTRAQMKEFYDKYYKPANAVLVIVGDMDAEKTFGLVNEMFSGIPRGTPVPKLDVVEPPQTAEKRVELKEDVEVDRLSMAWRGPAWGEPDDYTLDVVSSILGTGRTARLHQRLVEKDRIAAGLDVSNYSGRFPGNFIVQVQAIEGAPRGKIEAAIEEEIARLGEEGPTGEELERARNATLASFVYRTEKSSSMADLLASYACGLNLEELGKYVERLGAVTAADVKAAAKTYFRRESRVVCWSIAGGGDKDGRGDGEDLVPGAPRRHGKDPAAGGAGGLSLTKTKKVVLDNGLVLLLLEKRDVPIVSLQTFCRASQVYESEDCAGLANLVGALLEDGTASRSAEQIAQALEFVGGRLGTGPTGVEATVLSKDRDLALEIAFDILQHASFPEEKLELRRQMTLNQIASNRDEPRNLARYAFAEAVYGRHPLHRPLEGYEDTVTSLTRDDCVRHYRRYFVPNNTTVAIVGDFDAASVVSRVRELTKGWTVGLLDFPEFPPAERAAKGAARGIAIPEAKQVNVYVGHLGIRRSDPDWYALQVMDHVLSTGSGFTDRMSRTIRDEHGLVYTVGGGISGSAGIEPGVCRIFFATEPSKYERARAMVLKELARIREEPVPADELDAAKAYLKGSFALDLETNAELAGILLHIERFGLGFDYVERYGRIVEGITAADVLRVAKAHLSPEALHVVVAGPVDEKGELLGK